MKKGRSVYIEGKLETRKWTDKNGMDRYTTEVIATDMKMLGSRPGSDSFDSSGKDSHAQASGQSSTNKSNNGFDDMEDDIPF